MTSRLSQFVRATAAIACATFGMTAASATAHAQGLPRYSATRVLTIDGEKADLVPVGAMVVDKRGSTYVMQAQDHKILVFDTLGALVRTIGRKGNGPGEFLGLANIGFVGDTLWAWDAEKSRLTFFRADGKVARSSNILRITGEQMRFQPPLIRGVRADASVLSASVRRMPREVVEVFADSKGQTKRELAVRPMSEGGVLSFGSYDAGKFNPIGDPNPPIVVGARDGSRLAIATAILAGESAGTGSVTMLSYTGDTLFTRRYPIAIKPVPASLIDSILDAARRRGPQYAAMIEALPRAIAFPPLEYMRMSRDGALLLAFYTDGRERDFFIINAKGDIEAQLTLPAELIVKTFDAEHLWGTVRDANDLESIVRLKIAKESR